MSLYKRDEFTVIPGLGAQAEGYVLILADDHRFSSAEFSRDGLTRLERVKDDVAHALNQAYGPSIFFEHGACGSNSLAGGCIDHVHIHALPLEADVLALARARLNFTALDDARDVAGWRGRPYVSIETSPGAMHIAAGMNLPGQYLRRLVDQALGNRDEWDYVAYPQHERVRATIERLGPIFSSMWEAQQDDTRAGARLLPERPTVYLARAVDDRPPDEMVKVGERLRERLDKLGFAPIDPVVSPFPRLHARPDELEGDRRFGRIESDLAWLRRSDALVVDMSLDHWSYVGCVCELVYATLWGIPSVVITGNSNIAERLWLRYHATHIVKDVDDAMEVLADILPTGGADLVHRLTG